MDPLTATPVGMGARITYQADILDNSNTMDGMDPQAQDLREAHLGLPHRAWVLLERRVKDPLILHRDLPTRVCPNRWGRVERLDIHQIATMDHLIIMVHLAADPPACSPRPRELRTTLRQGQGRTLIQGHPMGTHLAVSS